MPLTYTNSLASVQNAVSTGPTIIVKPAKQKEGTEATVAP